MERSGRESERREGEVEDRETASFCLGEDVVREEDVAEYIGDIINSKRAFGLFKDGRMVDGRIDIENQIGDARIADECEDGWVLTV